MSATRSARVATSRSWARVFSSWVPKMAGWGTRQFSPYLGSMFRHCLLLIGLFSGAAAPASGQVAGEPSDRLQGSLPTEHGPDGRPFYQDIVRAGRNLLQGNAS